jgi:hypothetical protein
MAPVIREALGLVPDTGSPFRSVFAVRLTSHVSRHTFKPMPLPLPSDPEPDADVDEGERAPCYHPAWMQPTTAVSVA